MDKYNQAYELIKKKVGLKENQEYQRLYDPKDIWGQSLHPLALRHFKRFVATLYHLMAKEGRQFNLIIGGGDAGMWLAKVAEILYKKLDLKLPIILPLPIVRYKFTYLKYEGQPLELFNNSVLISEAKRQLKELKKLEDILYIDDEIANGITAKEAIRVVVKAVPRDKIAANINLVIVAEDQGFNTSNFLDNVGATMFSFAEHIPTMHGVINYIVPWEIERQIEEHFSEAEAGPKVRINMLLDLPSKDKKLMEGMYIPKPVFIYDYNRKVRQKILNFPDLQKEFRTSLDEWIDESIEEYKTS